MSSTSLQQSQNSEYMHERDVASFVMQFLNESLELRSSQTSIQIYVSFLITHDSIPATEYWRRVFWDQSIFEILSSVVFSIEPNSAFFFYCTIIATPPTSYITIRCTIKPWPWHTTCTWRLNHTRRWHAPSLFFLNFLDFDDDVARRLETGNRRMSQLHGGTGP